MEIEEVIKTRLSFRKHLDRQVSTDLNLKAIDLVSCSPQFRQFQAVEVLRGQEPGPDRGPGGCRSGQGQSDSRLA
jgi:hypothetical protein